MTIGVPESIVSGWPKGDEAKFSGAITGPGCPPHAVVALGDEGVVIGGTELRRVLLGQEAEVKAETARELVADRVEDDLQLADVEAAVAALPDGPVLSVVDARERAGLVGLVRRVASPVERTRKVVPLRGKPGSPLAASATATGLPLGCSREQ